MPSSPLELLMIGCSSSDSHAESIYDPVTGIEKWSSRGVDSNASVETSCIELFGNEYIIIVLKKQAALNVVGLHARDKTLKRIALPAPATYIAKHKDNQIISAAIDEKIFTWNICSGELFSIIRSHFQAITQLTYSKNGKYLVSASKDGCIQIHSLNWYLLTKRNLTDKEQLDATTHITINAHSMPIVTMQLCNMTICDENMRILTGSLDKTIKLIHPFENQILLTIRLDVTITVLAVNSLVSSICVGTDSGELGIIALHSEKSSNDRVVSYKSRGHNKDADRAILRGHKSPISKVCFNIDSQQIVSADLSGIVKFWQVSSLQCYRQLDMKGKSVNTLKFIPPLSVVLNSNQEQSQKRTYINRYLQYNVTENVSFQLPVNAHYETAKTDLSKNELFKFVSSLKPKEIKKPGENEQRTSVVKSSGKKDEQIRQQRERIANLEKDLVQAKSINTELAKFARQELLLNAQCKCKRDFKLIEKSNGEVMIDDEQVHFVEAQQGPIVSNTKHMDNEDMAENKNNTQFGKDSIIEICENSKAQDSPRESKALNNDVQQIDNLSDDDSDVALIDKQNGNDDNSELQESVKRPQICENNRNEILQIDSDNDEMASIALIEEIDAVSDNQTGLVSNSVVKEKSTTRNDE